MQHLQPHEFPSDFYYHRNSAEVYRPYLESCGAITTFDIGNPPQYAWKKHLFWGVYVSRFERTNIEPDIEKLKAEGIKHGIVMWIPYSRTDIPKSWRHMWINDHFQETSVNILSQNWGTWYRDKWSERARRSLKKFEKSGAEVRSVDTDTFVQAFEATRVKHWFKSNYISNFKRISKNDPTKIRQWLVYHEWEAVAGLACLDYLGDHSAHFVAFTGKKAYPIQWGTALIDTWFRESQDKGIKYITFDQLRNKWGPSDQKWYTEFKENFIEYRLSFPKAYFKMF